MFPSFVLSLREGLEAALIIGILMGALVKASQRRLRPIVWMGVAAATLFSLLGAILLHTLGTDLEGANEIIFEGSTMLLASVLLTWMIFWMGKQARSLKPDLESGVRRALSVGGWNAIFVLAFVSVLREGVELALYLTATSLTASGLQVMAGALLGLGAAAALGFSLFASLIRLDLRRFFGLTSVLLILFAAGLLAHGVSEFTQIGWMPALIPHVWDTNFLINENSILGQVLNSLFGYSGNPSLMQLIVYLGYFVIIGASQLLKRNIPARTETV